MEVIKSKTLKNDARTSFNNDRNVAGYAELLVNKAMEQDEMEFQLRLEEAGHAKERGIQQQRD